MKLSYRKIALFDPVEQCFMLNADVLHVHRLPKAFHFFTNLQVKNNFQMHQIDSDHSVVTMESHKFFYCLLTLYNTFSVSLH